MELGIIKNDVINELRGTRYYNEQEITRLVKTDTVSYKERIEQIVSLTRENANLIEAIKLVELYFPLQQSSSQVTPTETVE